MISRKQITIIILVVLLLIAWLVMSPPRFWLNLTKKVDLANPAAMGEQLVEAYECRRCHQISGQGALKAPSLAGVTTRLDSVSLRLWLLNPRAIKGNTAMPNFHLSDSEIEAIAAYLASLDG